MLASDVKWIKITTDIFDDEKILLIESLPDSYAIITVWFKLLCLAGKQNNSGVFMMGRIAYTDKMLATIFRMKEATVTMALRTFEQFGMVEIVDGVITIPNWGKHQNLDQLESKKEYMRNYMKGYREKQKALTAGKPNCKTNNKANVSQLERDIEEEKDKELDIEERNNDSSESEPPIEKKETITCQQIIDLYHSICISFPKVRSISDSRRKAIKARLNTYTIDDFRTLFENAERSSFLKGNNDRNWSASFDWLIKDSKMPLVIEGKYADKPQQTRYTRQEKKPNWMQPSMDYEEDQLASTYAMFKDDPAFEKEAEAMRKMLQEKYGRKEA